MREAEIQRFINAAQAAVERVALSVPIAANGDATEREATALRAATIMRVRVGRHRGQLMAKSSRPACQAVIDDHDRPKLYAPRQRIRVPGDKPCTRRAVAKLGPLCLCALHLRLAQEGMLRPDGRVLDKSTIRDIRNIRIGSRNPRTRRPDYQVETWHLNLKPEPLS